MKIKTFALAALAVLAGASGVQAQDGMDIGYIRTDSVMRAAPGVQEAQAELQQQVEASRTQVQELQQEIQELIQQYQAQENTLSEEARQTRQQEIQQRQLEAQQAAQQLQQQLQQREDEVLGPIMRRINEVMEEMREERDLDYILDASSGVILAASPDLDLTDELLQRLRAGAGASGGN